MKAWSNCIKLVGSSKSRWVAFAGYSHCLSWDWYYEYDVGFRYGTDPRNRVTKSNRCQTGGDILFQFLVEAITMCSVGGLLGVGLGIGASYGMANIAVKIVKVVPEWPAVISMQWMVISVTFSAAIGYYLRRLSRGKSRTTLAHRSVKDRVDTLVHRY